MKSRKKMLLPLLLGLFFSGALVAQSLNNDQLKKENQLKQKWIDENQQEYIDQGGHSGAVLGTNSKTEEGILVGKTSDNGQVPEFNSKAEKEEWFNTNISPEEAQEPNRTETKNAVYVLPNDETFPVYAKTGDKALDDENYAQQKQEWINNNPAKYAKMSNPSPSKAMSAEEKKERMTVNQTNNK